MPLWIVAPRQIARQTSQRRSRPPGLGAALDFGQQHGDRTFGGFKQDVAREPVADYKIGSTAKHVMALDEADEFNPALPLAEPPGSFADHVGTLAGLAADVEQTDPGRTLQERAHCRIPEHGKFDQTCGIDADVRAEIQHPGRTSAHWKFCHQRRTLDPGQHAQCGSRQRHQRAGVAGADRGIGSAGSDLGQRQRHAGLASVSQGLGRTRSHRHEFGAAHEFAAFAQRSKLAVIQS